MKIVLSPAKSLDYTSPIPTKEYTIPLFLKEAKVLDEVLKAKSPQELAKLMHISEKLAELNWKRFQEWSLPFTPENARQAIFAFNGAVYDGLDAYSLTEEQIQNLQNKLRILSGMYGFLRPLDLMQPYRLEMGTKLKFKSYKNLYEFWKDKVTNTLNSELSKNEPFINLASNEYFKVIDKKKLKTKIITPVFKDFKNGELKIIAIYAKKARGMMVRYIIENNIENVTDLKGFNMANYAFDSKLSTETELVFTR
ncbi:MAG TPA: peroxide stress protein YaaA [Flavobacteriia bacterium]|nr:peroxide stress protein YaaA [Flavobacteriia bacterium]